MVEERENPFAPGAGEVPPHRAGHEAAVRELTRRVRRVVGGRPGGMVILHGPRGNGKTALLAELYGMARERQVRVAELDTGLMTGDPEKLAEMLEPMKKLPIPEIAGLKVKFPGLVEAAVEFNTAEATPLGNMLLSLLRGPLVLMIDEAHDMPARDGKVLLQVCQRFIRHGLPLLLVLAGTPGIEASLRRIGASFWERARRLKIGRLETRDAGRDALSIPMGRSGLSVGKDALETIPY